MISFTKVPTEQTSAATDIVLVIIAAIIWFYLYRSDFQPYWKRYVWLCFYALLFLSALLAGFIHGTETSQNIRVGLWYTLFIFLGLFLVSFTLAVLNDLIGEYYSKKALPYALLAGFIFFILAVVKTYGFLTFVVYQALAMSLVVIGYAWLGWTGRLPGAWYMALGGVFSFTAVVFQVRTSLEFTFIWTFNHNGVYHLVQAVGVLFFFVGIKKSFQAVI
ncbi:DUF6962 family protein [Microbulbifer variabilis]|uniref:DUF6962 family protein n=1 Tax=Microbulbifer variabilis TaxID=266805 RepID=UPI001CFD38A7|nr:hypothetical protein [Microbulbifer variabilis]